MNGIFEDLFDYVKNLEIIDTHEHLPAFEHLREQDTDVLKEYLTHYYNCEESQNMKLRMNLMNGNILYNSDPSLLSNLFLEYPDVDFDIFHMGYPYQDVVAVLAKNFPNVYIDMCWAHIVSPIASINALVSWIDSVPINKISAFGGDYLFVDGVYGHQYMARVNVSKALAKKVEEGVMEIDRAKEIAEMVFYQNPYKIFKLEGRL